MKGRTIKGQIMFRFVLYSIVLYLAVIPLQILVGWLMDIVAQQFHLSFDANFSILPRQAQIATAAILIGWAGATILVYMIGIALFGRGIGNKVIAPINRLVDGMQKLTGGKLDERLENESIKEFEVMRASFNQMAQQLEAAEQDKARLESERTQLYSSIAHDLKTPMTTISGYAGALADGVVDDPEKQIKYLRSIQHKSRQVNEMLDLLFAYSKMETPGYTLNKEAADLAELVRSACASLFEDFEAKKMILDMAIPDGPLFAEIDCVEYVRAVENLLTNAIRHNPPGTMVRTALEKTDDGICFSVSDSGAPIPDALATTLFNPFSMGDESRNSKNGSGLGLSIVKKVAEKHGGTTFLEHVNAPYSKRFVLVVR